MPARWQRPVPALWYGTRRATCCMTWARSWHRTARRCGVTRSCGGWRVVRQRLQLPCRRRRRRPAPSRALHGLRRRWRRWTRRWAVRHQGRRQQVPAQQRHVPAYRHAPRRFGCSAWRPMRCGCPACLTPTRCWRSCAGGPCCRWQRSPSTATPCRCRWQTGMNATSCCCRTAAVGVTWLRRQTRCCGRRCRAMRRCWRPLRVAPPSACLPSGPSSATRPRSGGTLPPTIPLARRCRPSRQSRPLRWSVRWCAACWRGCVPPCRPMPCHPTRMWWWAPHAYSCAWRRQRGWTARASTRWQRWTLPPRCWQRACAPGRCRASTTRCAPPTSACRRASARGACAARTALSLAPCTP